MGQVQVMARRSQRKQRNGNTDMAETMLNQTNGANGTRASSQMLLEPEWLEPKWLEPKWLRNDADDDDDADMI